MLVGFTYGGYTYATIDGTPYDTSTSTCQDGAFNLPTGCVVAPADTDGISVASMWGWGTHVVVYANGVGYRTKNYLPAGEWNSFMLSPSAVNGAHTGLTAYGVNSCSLRVLIRCSGQPF